MGWVCLATDWYLRWASTPTLQPPILNSFLIRWTGRGRTNASRDSGIRTDPNNSIDSPAAPGAPAGRRPFPAPRWRTGLVAPLFFAVVTFGLFADLLVNPGSKVAGDHSQDLEIQFLAWLSFAFGQLRAGHLPLWNPHIFGGQPFVGGFQSALFYPLNWLHLVVPMAWAINWGMAIHVFLAGWFTSLWARGRGQSVAASIVAGMMFMFCGPYFLRIEAGHLPALDAMTWGPLLYLAVDRWQAGGRLGSVWLGGLAVAMQIFAGHPQYVYYTALAVGLYTLLHAFGFIRRGRSAIPPSDGANSGSASPGSARLLGGVMAMYVIGALLAAVQLLEGYHAATQSWRGGGTGLDVVGQYSFPPENLLTFLAPQFLGPFTHNGHTLGYFGRWLLWEACGFISVTGFVLAICGALFGSARRRWVDVAVALLVIIAALGQYTPLLALLYHTLPLFRDFRSPAKFMYIAALFASILAGYGLDRLLDAALSMNRRRGLAMATFVVAAAAGVIAIAINGSAGSGTAGVWGRLMVAIGHTDANLPPLNYSNANFIADSAENAASCFGIATGLLAIDAILILMTARYKVAARLLVVLAGIELVVFAWGNRPAIDAQIDYPRPWANLLQRMPSQDRVYHADFRFQDAGMCLGYDDVWGYDPGLMKRWGQFVAVSQGIAPDSATQFMQLTKFGTMTSMLRLKYAFPLDPNAPVLELPDPLPVALLVGGLKIVHDRDTALAELSRPEFDPRATVVLESMPETRPHVPEGATFPVTSPPADPSEQVQIVARTTDSLDLVVTASRARILLVTNAWCDGWKAVPTASGPQEQYSLVPADWALMGIPLLAGTHHLRLIYQPWQWGVGKWVSSVSLAGFIAVGLVLLIRGRRPLATPAS